jgi:hypothetical protein
MDLGEGRVRADRGCSRSLAAEQQAEVPGRHERKEAAAFLMALREYPA